MAGSPEGLAMADLACKCACAAGIHSVASCRWSPSQRENPSQRCQAALNQLSDPRPGQPLPKRTGPVPFRAVLRCGESGRRGVRAGSGGTVGTG
jgi:hypothetical protein